MFRDQPFKFPPGTPYSVERALRLTLEDLLLLSKKRDYRRPLGVALEVSHGQSSREVPQEDA